MTNAGGMNPASCARRPPAVLLAKPGLGDEPIGVVTGDDLAVADWPSCRRPAADSRISTPASRSTLRKQPVVSANAYLGARPIADALAGGARFVITGRVADASLTVGPAMHEFGWAWDDWNRLAAASVAGHLIECGAQATGGLYRHWEAARPGRRRLSDRRTDGRRRRDDHQAGRHAAGASIATR